jgi:hypothetical protein
LEKKRVKACFFNKSEEQEDGWSMVWLAQPERGLKTTLSSLLEGRTTTKEEAKRNQKVLQEQTRTNPGEKKGSPDLCSSYLQGKRKTNCSK